MSPSIAPFEDYAEVHTNSHGAGDERPTAVQILQNEGLLEFPNRLAGKTVLITGGNSGLGLEEAKALYLAGAKVFITGRCDSTKGREIAASVGASEKPPTDGAEDKSTTGQPLHPVSFISVDLSDLDLVQKAAVDFLAQSKNKLNLLICNAGVMSPQTRTTTAQSHEMQFGVNYLAHFLLIKLLCNTLLACSANDFKSRVIAVSSCAHRNGGLVADGDYDFEKTKYDPGTSYGQSKTASIYMANELERRFGAQGLHGLSVHPGVIMETSLVRHMTDDSKKLTTQIADGAPTFERQIKSAPQGAGSVVWAAVAAKLEGVGGLYLENCDVSQPVKDKAEWFDPGYSNWCYDGNAESKLWSDSEALLAPWL